MSILIVEWTSSGGEARSIPHTKEDGKGQNHGGEGEEQRQAASGGQKTTDGGQASGFRTAELCHRERRKHRDLRPRGSDATLTDPKITNSSRPDAL